MNIKDNNLTHNYFGSSPFKPPSHSPTHPPVEL